MKKTPFFIIILFSTFLTYKSIAQWNTIGRPSSSIHQYHSVDFADSPNGNLGYLIGNQIEDASDNCFFKTTNEGNTWIQTPISPATVNVTPNAIACSNDGNVVIIVGLNGVIKRSINGGLTFQDDIHQAGTNNLTNCEIFDNMAVTIGLNGIVLINPNIYNSCWFKVSTSSSTDLYGVSIGYTTIPGEFIIYVSGSYKTIMKVVIKDLCSLPKTTCNNLTINFGTYSNIFYDIKTIFGNSKNVVAVRGLNQLIYSTDYGTNWIELSVPPSVVNGQPPALYDIACSTTNLFFGGHITINGDTYHCVSKQISASSFSTSILGLADQNIPGVNGFFTPSLTFNNNNMGYFVGRSLNFYKTTNAKSSDLFFSQVSEYDIELSNSTTKENNYENGSTEFNLLQNIPNPFNEKSIIQFNLISDNFITLKTYDIMWRQVEQLISGNGTAGYHEIQIDAKNYKPGIYFYVLTCGELISSKKFVVTK
jgi:hypothetical protein